MSYKKYTVVTGVEATQTLLWIGWANLDYSAARLLFILGLLSQGAVFATTAIEKYLKSICCHAKINIPKRGGAAHDIHKLYLLIKKHPSHIQLFLNEDYLKLLSKVYRLRYHDDLERGFNVALNQAKILAQLDRSVLEITTRYRFVYDGKALPSIFDEAIANNDPGIIDKNVALSPHRTKELFSTPGRSYEFRNHNGQMREADYPSFGVEDDLVFDTEGLYKGYMHAYPTILKWVFSRKHKSNKAPSTWSWT
jgi:HEPN domain-containing protein